MPDVAKILLTVNRLFKASPFVTKVLTSSSMTRRLTVEKSHRLGVSRGSSNSDLIIVVNGLSFSISSLGEDKTNTTDVASLTLGRAFFHSVLVGSTLKSKLTLD